MGGYDDIADASYCLIRNLTIEQNQRRMGDFLKLIKFFQDDVLFFNLFLSSDHIVLLVKDVIPDHDRLFSVKDSAEIGRMKE